MKKDDDIYKESKLRIRKLKELEEKIKVAEALTKNDKKLFSQFTTRVELHGAITKSDFDNLNSEMLKEKFTCTIFFDGLYKLPTAEYNKEGYYTMREVLDSAVRAATLTGKKFSILVTKSVERGFINLDIMEK